MEKTYYQFMAEIRQQEIYDKLIAYGLFSENLPPIFTSEPFLKYCKSEHQTFKDDWYPFAKYESMRNNNTPRPIGIPVPMAHERLCSVISQYWPNILDYFREKTSNQKRKVSRIHIRKMRNNRALFEMNYKNWKVDGTPEPDILIGKQYLVRADISKCYPSIYSHAIPWALVGKEVAKKNVGDKRQWYNQIDHWVHNSKNGETHGLLIGPHTSNILSEIVLCAVDEKLCDAGYDYFRNVDDYQCYVSTKDEADKFLITLNAFLQEYDLSLNHNKSSIAQLPIGVVEEWTRKIQDRTTLFEKKHPYVDYKEVQSFLDYCVVLMNDNKNNSAILKYALKVLKDFTLTTNAKKYLVGFIYSLSLIYSYLVPMLDRYVFEVYDVPTETIKSYILQIFNVFFPKKNYEACSIAVQLAIKYDAEFEVLDLDSIINTGNCILMLVTYLYCKRIDWKSGEKKLKKYAKSLLDNNQMEENWPFVYEVLGVGSLKDDWKQMKKRGISFIREEYGKKPSGSS